MLPRDENCRLISRIRGSIFLFFLFTLGPIISPCWAQSPDQIGADPSPPASHPDNSVIRRQQADLDRLREESNVMRRYQEMLANNRSREYQQQSVSQSFPGSYQFDSASQRYVRRQLPPRLIPPAQSHPNQSPYKLKQQPATKYSAPQRRVPQQNFNSWNTGSNHEPTNGYPPIVRPDEVSPAIGQPVFFGRTGHQQNEEPSSAEHPRVIRGSWQIPSNYQDGATTVTRARILLQEPTDPFGQVPELGRGPQESDPQEDPFADPKSLQDFNAPEDPFDKIPDDLDPDRQNQDPFTDPPDDIRRPDQNQDPFDPTSRINEVDPFPPDPGNLQPQTDYQPPVESQDQNQSEQPVVPVAPDKDPTKIDNRTKLKSGPYYNRPDFRPSPIKPAPPRREFENYQLPNEPLIEGYEFYQQPMVDQPTLLANGFDKQELYEGIPQRNLVAECTYCEADYSEPQEFTRRRLIDRWLPRRFSIFDTIGDQCSECCPAIEGQNCDDLCTFCQPAIGDARLLDGCFEPLFYLSVFGGYNQLENSDLLIDQNSGQNAFLQFNDGFGIGGALGQIQGENLRIEFELTYRSNQLEDLTGTFLSPGGNPLDWSGSHRSVSGMVNMLWDFSNWPRFYNLQPYVGGGIGFAIFDTNLLLNGVRYEPFGDGRDSSFAYQLMAGFARPLSQRMDGFIEYRYFSADAIPLDLGDLEGDLFSESDTVFFGVRMHY